MILSKPANRLRLLLDIAQRNLDVAELADADVMALAEQLRPLVPRHSIANAGLPRLREQLAEGLLELQRWLAGLTSRARAELSVSDGYFVYLLTEDGDLARSFFGSFAVALVDEAASLLQRAGPHRLRTCPLLLKTGTRCGRLFIGERHQRFCTPPHARIHARRQYRRREQAARQPATRSPR